MRAFDLFPSQTSVVITLGHLRLLYRSASPTIVGRLRNDLSLSILRWMRENARALRGAIVLVIACAVCAGTAAAELRAGRAAVRITPAAGVPMGSSYGLTISAGTHDDLYVKALALESGEARVAIVACDLISLRPA